MDINTALEEARHEARMILADDTASDLPERATALAEKFEAIDQWLRRDGHLPADWIGRKIIHE
jgi:hypothetical protein